MPPPLDTTTNPPVLRNMFDWVETVRGLLPSPIRGRVRSAPVSPKLLMKPSFSSVPKFSLPSTQSSSSSSSLSSSSASSFWMSRPTNSPRSSLKFVPATWRGKITKRQIAVLICVLTTAVVWFAPPPSTWHRQHKSDIGNHLVVRPVSPAAATAKNAPDPVRWLRENANDKHAVSGNSMLSSTNAIGSSGKPKAALISLVRNSELEGLVQSMRQLEFQWNHKYQYPWIFFNDEPFSDEFKVSYILYILPFNYDKTNTVQATTQALTSAKCYYEVVPPEHWSLPDWIDEGRFMNSLEYLGAIGVGKGWMTSYRHMCRWNSGFFYKHPRLLEFDWYWRVEPDVSVDRDIWNWFHC